MLKKVITWGIVIFVIYYLVSNPGGAANVVHSAFDGMKTVGHSFSGFWTSL
jgi:hypothetical protein